MTNSELAGLQLCSKLKTLVPPCKVTLKEKGGKEGISFDSGDETNNLAWQASLVSGLGQAGQGAMEQSTEQEESLGQATEGSLGQSEQEENLGQSEESGNLGQSEESAGLGQAEQPSGLENMDQPSSLGQTEQSSGLGNADQPSGLENEEETSGLEQDGQPSGLDQPSGLEQDDQPSGLEDPEETGKETEYSLESEKVTFADDTIKTGKYLAILQLTSTAKTEAKKNQVRLEKSFVIKESSSENLSLIHI